MHKHQTQNFQRIIPFEFDIAPVKKHIRPGHAGVVNPYI